MKKENVEIQKLAYLVPLCATFARVANIVDKLPELPSDDTPLREFIPGIWPTIGDVRRIRDELKRLGWKG